MDDVIYDDVDLEECYYDRDEAEACRRGELERYLEYVDALEASEKAFRRPRSEYIIRLINAQKLARERSEEWTRSN